MRLFVTGAAGFIGSHVAEALLARGHQVTGFDGFVANYHRGVLEANLEVARRHPAFRLIEGDLRTADLRAALDGVDAIVHEAALPGLVRSWEDFAAYDACNVLGTQRLLAAAVSAGVRRFVHASTSSVYGEVAVGDESLPVRPNSPYGVTKLAAEHLIGAYGVHGVRAVVLRYFSVYGPRQRPDMAYQIFIEGMSRGEPVEVFGDGEQSRSNTYIDDCVAATVSAVESGAEGTYNVGGGESITVNKAIELVGKALGVTPRVVYRDGRPGDQRRTLADFSKATEALGFRPVVTPEEGIRRQVEWYRSRTL